MSDTPGLSVPLSIPLSKYEKQLARAEAMAVKRANNIQRKFEEANGRGAQALTKSAASSAQVFERAIQKETRAFQQLKASVDPAYAAQRRYEAAVRQVESAVRIGAISQQDANAVLEMSRAKHLGAAGAAKTHAAAAGGMFKVSNAGRFVLQNTTSQVADMAVQMEMGTNPMRIMGQQLPQVFGGFSALGGVLGTVAPLLGVIAAIGFPVAAFLLTAGNNAEDGAEKVKDFADAFDKAEAAINRANSAVSRAASGDIDALKEAYGAVDEKIVSLINSLARLKVQAALDEVSTAWSRFQTENTQVDKILSQIDQRIAIEENIRNQIADLQSSSISDSSLVQDQIDNLSLLADQMADLKPISDIWKVDVATVASIRDVRDAIEEAVESGSIENLTEAVARMRTVLATIPDGPLADMADELAVAEDLLRRALAQSKRLETSAGGINFDAATASASRMADEISRAVDAMHDLRSQGLTDLETAQIRYQYRDDPVARAGALAGAKYDRETAAFRESGFENVGEEAFYRQQRKDRIDEAREIARLNEASRPPRKSKGGGSRSRQEFDLFAGSEREITALERQIEMVGRSRQEVVELTAKYELLDAAKEKGINLDQRSAETGRSLRDEIDQQAASIAKLTVEAEHYAEQAEFMADLNQDLKDGMIDAIVEGKNFGEVLDNVAKQLAKAALQAALFGEGPMARLFGGGSRGLLGGLFGGGLSFFARGTSYAPGGVAVVGEEGPELIHLPRGSKVIPNHKLGQNGGQSQVDVFVHPSGEFDTRVRQISGDVAVNVSGQMISENNRSLSEMQRR